MSEEVKNEPFVNERGNIQKSFADSQSSQIRTMEHNAVTLDLIIEFKGGAKYRYLNVPADVFQGALDTQSPGAYHASKIKRDYEFERIWPPAVAAVEQ